MDICREKTTGGQESGIRRSLDECTFLFWIAWNQLDPGSKDRNQD